MLEGFSKIKIKHVNSSYQYHLNTTFLLIKIMKRNAGTVKQDVELVKEKPCII